MGTLTVFENGLEQIITLTGTVTQLGLHSSNVSSVYCCKDLEGGFCNRADKLTDSFCSSQFSDSPAGESGCTASSATADTDDEECTITANCKDSDDNTVSSTLTVDLAATSSIQVCSDHTIASSC